LNKSSGVPRASRDSCPYDWAATKIIVGSVVHTAELDWKNIFFLSTRSVL